MIYRGIQDEIHLLLTFSGLMAFLGFMVALQGELMSYQSATSIGLAIIGIIFSHIAHYQWKKNPKINYPTIIVIALCWANLFFLIYLFL